jgi:hypothetical protein
LQIYYLYGSKSLADHLLDRAPCTRASQKNSELIKMRTKTIKPPSYNPFRYAFNNYRPGYIYPKVIGIRTNEKIINAFLILGPL